MNDIQHKVFAAFQSEHKKHLETMRRFLATRSSATGSVASELEEVERSAHTLKGAARAAGLEYVQELGLRLEQFFKRLKEDQFQLDDRVMPDLHAVLDGIEVYVADVAADPGTTPPQGLMKIMDRLFANDTVQAATGRRVEASGEGADSGAEKPAVPLQDDDIRRKVLAAFQNEYRIHLEAIRRIVDAKTTDGPPDPARINLAFRSAHTLKGAARAVDLPEVQQLAHGIEAVFAGIRDGTLSFQIDVIQAVANGLDAIEDHVVSLAGPKPSAIPRSAIDTIENLASKSPGPPPNSTQGDKERETGHATEMSANGAAAIRIDAARMDRIQRTAEQIMAEGMRHQLVSVKIRDLEKTVSFMAQSAVHRSAVLRKTTSRMKDLPELQELFQYVQDQRHHLAMLAAGIRDLGRRQTTATRINDNLSKQIQVKVQRARMVAAEDVFQPFRKMVRDLAVDEDKQIELHIKGLEVQADRLVLQRLKDPLMHMLRNAVSHGIESAEARRAAGKKPTGTIGFSIEIIGNRMQLTITDDGKGVDAQQIAEQAVRKGYASDDQIGRMNPEERLQFIYLHGFTTAKMITDLHGRGIGMAVVRDTVNRLRGEIHVTSEVNQGTRFVLQIPLTISTHRLLLVQAGGQTFGLPVQNIDRLFRIHWSDIESIEGNPVINADDQPVPFATLADLLNLGQSADLREGEQIFVALLHSAGKKMGLAVDDVLAEAEFLIKDLPPPVDRVPFFSCGFIRGDGSVSLMVNPSMLMDALYQSNGREMFTGRKKQATEKRRARILIVDDSVTTRTLEKTLLESQGYDIRVAVDGVEALHLLTREDVDLVVTDIQMPNMDGFALIEEMKKTKKLQDLPVIIVTSRADQKDRQRGLNLGADAYIVKQKFDQRSLLETIGQML